MSDLGLENRAGLPDALRVLLAEFPRLTWQDDPGFNDLIKFWLDRHLMFRRILGEMKSDAERLLDAKIPADQYAGRLSRYGGMFVNGLHEHHTIEDTYYFPKLVTHDDRIAAGFDILDKDHHAIDGHLNTFVENANDVLGHRDDKTKLQNAAGRFQAGLVGLETLIDRHLNDEEELIVPVILKYGAPDMG